jgi:hypothetical protein
MRLLQRRSGDDSYKAELVLLAYYYEFIDMGWHSHDHKYFMTIYYSEQHTFDHNRWNSDGFGHMIETVGTIETIKIQNPKYEMIVTRFLAMTNKMILLDRNVQEEKMLRKMKNVKVEIRIGMLYRYGTNPVLIPKPHLQGQELSFRHQSLWTQLGCGPDVSSFLNPNWGRQDWRSAVKQVASREGRAISGRTIWDTVFISNRRYLLHMRIFDRTCL